MLRCEMRNHSAGVNVADLEGGSQDVHDIQSSLAAHLREARTKLVRTEMARTNVSHLAVARTEVEEGLEVGEVEGRRNWVCTTTSCEESTVSRSLRLASYNTTRTRA